MINPKLQILNPKQYQNQKSKIKNILNLVFGIYLGFGILSLGFVVPVYAQTKTLKNIGFIQDNIWYSKDPFFEGDKIRIYTAVFNGSRYDFKGTLEFFVNPDEAGRGAGGKSVGKSSFSLISGAFQVLWADWVAEKGNKKIYANITEAKISLPGGLEETVILENAKTGEIETFVDKDSDKDGTGDKNDPKDDGVPEQKQTESKALEKSLTNSTQSDGGGTVSKLPDSKEVASAAKQSASIINGFLAEQKEKAEARKAEIQKKLSENESLFEFDFGNLTEKNSEGENKNLLKLYALALSALIFSLEYKVIIYLFGIYIAYCVLKFAVKKMFFRHVDN